MVARFSDRDRSIADAAVAKAEAELSAPAMLKDLACAFRKSNTRIQTMKSAKKWTDIARQSEALDRRGVTTMSI